MAAGNKLNDGISILCTSCRYWIRTISRYSKENKVWYSYYRLHSSHAKVFIAELFINGGVNTTNALDYSHHNSNVGIVNMTNFMDGIDG